MNIKNQAQKHSGIWLGSYILGPTNESLLSLTFPGVEQDPWLQPAARAYVYVLA